MSDKILFENPFVAIIDRDGYTFLRETRADGKIVSVLPFRFENGKFTYLARLEVCPAHSPDLERCSITGGLEKIAGETPEHRAAEELWEEAGYRIDKEALIPLGIVRPSKASDTTVYLFAANVTGLKQHPAPGDGSKFEMGASTEWLTLEQALDVQDPLFLAAILRLRAKHPLELR